MSDKTLAAIAARERAKLQPVKKAKRPRPVREEPVVDELAEAPEIDSEPEALEE